MAKPNRIIFTDLEAMSHEAAKRFVKASQKAIAVRGQFVTALPGGRTPKRAYELLARSQQPRQPPPGP